MTTTAVGAVRSSEDIIAESTAVLAHHGRSFRLASHFLPRKNRDDAAVVYAFCRLVDDLADEAPDPQTARHDLDEVLRELRGTQPPRPLIHAYLEVCRRCSIDEGAAGHLIEAVLSDLDTVAVKTDEELLRYCYGVAGTVGLMMCGVLGVTDPRAQAHAVDLGIGMQLTNICRDVKEDAAMGRVYLPESRLEVAQTSQASLLAGDASPEAVAGVVRDLLAEAETYYRSAEDGMRFIPLRPRSAIVIASRVYRAIGLRLLRLHKGNALLGRTVVPTWERLVWVLRGAAATLSPRIAGWSSYTLHQRSLHTALRGLPGSNPPV